MSALPADSQADIGPATDSPCRRLFIVERNAAIRRIQALIFSAYGWRVRTFSSAGECLGAALTQPPDCILSDLYPADMDASRLQAALRREGIGVPMVILAAYADSPVSAALQTMGIVDVLELPCSTRTVEAAMTRLLPARA